MNAQRVSAAVALVTAAAGIGIQILGGADYPTVPPGAIILLVAAAICVWWRSWWAPLIAAAAALFLLIGGLIAPNAADNLSAGGGPLWGTVVQFAALVVALVTAVAAALRERRIA
jgi:hypothetical protein